MDRLTNYFFGLLIIYLFIMEGRANDHLMILSGFGLSMVIAYLAFMVKWITLDAIKPVIILGTITLGFGGWWLALALVYFFTSSSLISWVRKKLNRLDDQEFPPAVTLMQQEYRRDGYQVWANGFWVATFATVWFLTGIDTFWLASVAVIATATSDTWATEIGSIRPGKTIRIDNFKTVKPGTDGGISFKGIVAAILGSLTAALFIIPVFGYIIKTTVIVFLSGFAGSLVDSYAGAIYQNYDEPKRPDEIGYATRSPEMQRNNFVNWVATGTGGLLTLLILNIISL